VASSIGELESQLPDLDDQSSRGIAAVAALQQPVCNEPGDLVARPSAG
jgi:hypothetical protein